MPALFVQIIWFVWSTRLPPESPGLGTYWQTVPTGQPPVKTLGTTLSWLHLRCFITTCCWGTRIVLCDSTEREASQLVPGSRDLFTPRALSLRWFGVVSCAAVSGDHASSQRITECGLLFGTPTYNSGVLLGVATYICRHPCNCPPDQEVGLFLMSSPS